MAMNKTIFSSLFLISIVIFSCSDDETKPGDGSSNGESRTFDEAMEKFTELENIIIDLTTSEGLTRESEFPTSGVVTYKGIHMSKRTLDNLQTSETEILYVADMTITLDFATQQYTGELSNFTTNLEGFENPEGTLEVAGSIRGTDDLGGDEFGLSLQVKDDELVQGERTAIFDGQTANKGRFYGNDAQFIAIGVTATFDWVLGPDAESTSGTIGFVYIQAVE